MNIVDAICVHCEKTTIKWLTGSPRLCPDCARTLRLTSKADTPSFVQRRREADARDTTYTYPYAVLEVNG